MVPAISHVVLIPQVYLAGSLCPILQIPFFPLKYIAKCPVPLVPGLGPKIEIVFVAIEGALEGEDGSWNATLVEHDFNVEGVHVAICPAEGDLEDLVELGESERGR